MNQGLTSDAPFPRQPEQMVELRRLVAQLLDQQITSDGWQRLNQILREQAAAREYYLKSVAMHGALANLVGNSIGTSAFHAHLAVERMVLDQLSRHDEEHAVSWPAGTHSVASFFKKKGHMAALYAGPERLQPNHSAPVMTWGAVVTAIVLLGLLALGGLWRSKGRDLATVDRAPDGLAREAETVAKTPAAETRAAETPAADADPPADSRVAAVTYVSPTARWQDSNNSYALASYVPAGQCLMLEQGRVELTYSSGAKLLLTGRSEFVVHSTGGKLRRGEIMARVPDAGHGFTIETPYGKVIDLGTEFGVVIDDFGVSQVSVFEGKVETLPTATVGTLRDKIELTTGRALQWTGDSVIPMATPIHRYPRPSDDPQLDRWMPPTQRSVDDAFRDAPLDTTRWQALGEITPSAEGLRMNCNPASNSRPYLLTAKEWDPSLGAIRIVCDIRFENLHDAQHASVSILTRCADERSKPGTLWHDMLARSVRCCLKSEFPSGEGMLEVGTKYEADREHTVVRWGGFSRPQPDSVYRLEMRDDGLNVTFTVCLSETPSVKKTITCRSLFRGNRNFIALEGGDSGSTIVERMAITQDHPPTRDNSGLATSIEGLDVETELSRLAPSDGTVIVRDDFEADQLDMQTWTVLGEVVLRDGQLQLGVDNEGHQIDTWHARPYLLTKERLDPADGPLVIVGQITFTDNFLNGYGGSFAVMTRSDRAHGGGPGWENSILRQGVRANFWPAAYGFDHSLQIHEKPSANTVSLLAADPFPVAPLSRSYFFRCEDDGGRVEWTIVDATNPTIRKTIGHPTATVYGRSGHVGFESCWGSPVLLDKVRIYRRPAPPVAK